jgi:hypothetical protein
VVLDKQQAAELYLQLADLSNVARDRWIQAGPLNASNLAAHTDLAARAAEVTGQFAASLNAHQWPVAATPSVQRLAADLSVRARAYQRVAQTRTVGDYVAAAIHVPLNSAASIEVRQALGLPPAATSCVCSPH